MERRKKVPFSDFFSESSGIFYCVFDLSCQLCLFLTFHHPCCSNPPPKPLTLLKKIWPLLRVDLGGGGGCCGFFVIFVFFFNFIVNSYFSTYIH